MAPYSIHIPVRDVSLAGELVVPAGAKGIVIFSHGSGSSRHSPRNKYVADVMRRHGFATLLFDLLTEEEDASSYERRFDIPLLTDRLVAVTRWLSEQPVTHGLPAAYFGASTGAASALKAAAALSGAVRAVVSRGGRPDLAMDELERVKAPVLLIVGGHDPSVIELNRQALERLRCEKEMAIVKGATHLFEEPGTLEEAAKLAAAWYEKYLAPAAPHAPADTTV